MNKFVLLIAGTRTYDDWTQFEYIVDLCLSKIPKNCEIEIVHGGAKGADSLANTYTNDNGYKCTVFNADWSIGKSAGYIRNKQMHDYIKQFEHRGCLCFWDGKSKGTQHNFKLANDNGTKLKVYNYVEHKFMKGE